MIADKAYIHELNVVRFETLLMRETDAKLRERLQNLLSDEKVMLEEALRREAAVAS